MDIERLIGCVGGENGMDGPDGAFRRSHNRSKSLLKVMFVIYPHMFRKVGSEVQVGRSDYCLSLQSSDQLAYSSYDGKAGICLFQGEMNVLKISCFDEFPDKCLLGLKDRRLIRRFGAFSGLAFTLHPIRKPRIAADPVYAKPASVLQCCRFLVC